MLFLWGLPLPDDSSRDLFGMVSSRDPNSKVVGYLQLGDKKFALNHPVDVLTKTTGMMKPRNNLIDLLLVVCLQILVLFMV